jgi:CHAT domain-containing protein/tetratricopeptide (TPR) repeat protein
MTTTKLGALVFGIILAVCAAGERAVARPADVKAIRAALTEMHEQAHKFYSAGKLSEGIAEAHKFEEAAKAKLGVEDPYYASALQDIGQGYFFLSNMSAAEGLFNRALAIRKKVFGENHRAVANNLNDLALVYSSQRKFTEAENCFKQSLAIEEKLGGDKREITATLNNLARLYWSQGRYDEAEPMIKQVLEIDEGAKGPNHPDVATSLSVLAAIYRSQQKYADATRTYERELAIMEQVYGPNDPEVVRPLHGLAILGMSTNVDQNIARTLGHSRRAIAVEIANQAVERSGLDGNDGNQSPIGLRPSVFRRGLSVFAVAAALGAEPRSALGVEGFEAAQWATLSSAAAAVQQMGLRFSVGNDGLAVLVRERQDLTVRWREVDKSLASALGSPESQRNTAAADAIRGRRAEIQSQLAAVVAKLEKDFPGYAALASPKALKVAEVQRLLSPDEALIYWMIDENRSFVFALTRDAFDWQVIPLGEKELTAGVGYFRRGLDVGILNSPEALSGKKVLFDLPLANRFYNALLGPVASVVRTKQHLLVVPSGPLTALPFHLLVTDPPPGEADIHSLALYRDAAWLLRRHAVTVLPSVSSLQTLRVLAPKQHAARPMIGFGDPVFDASAEARRPAKGGSKVASRSYTDFWQGIGVDRGELAKALPRLEDTADELKAVAKNLGAPPGDIYLRNAASEGTVKRLRLSDYRVVYFATHGLVAGDVKGLAEPSLVLSIPKQPTELDDGLLTASEVAQLKLNADWVVLSACNTIAGDKPGAEALSGLARSFFYAGARALLVSHWAVDSAAATRLAISTFDNLKSNPAIGRAEALRQAMLGYLNDTSSPVNAYPAFWGPFALIGEGAAR